jgi:hypothetical protein
VSKHDSKSPDVGAFPPGDRVPATEVKPESELHMIGRTLDDLAPPQKLVPRPGGVLTPILWAGLVLAALLALVIGLPSVHSALNS